MTKPTTADLRRAVLARNLTYPAAPREDLLDTFDRLAASPVGERVAGWARFFLDRGVPYLYGDAGNGYVTQGRLVDDTATDCMLLTMRVFELAQSSNPTEAIERALAGRFPGVPLDAIANSDGVLDYEHPYRRRFALDLMREGFYGTDVTESLGRTVPDPGTPRPTSADVPVLPKDTLEVERLVDGDALWFVLAPDTQAEVRERSHAIIGHMGIISRPTGTDPSEIQLIHAASKPLVDVYDGGKVVSVDLATYLDRVETFHALRVSRCW